MTSVRARPALLALLAVLAIAVAAATLNSAVVVDDEIGPGSGPGGGSLAGDGRGDEEDGSPAFSVGFDGVGGRLPVVAFPCYPFLKTPAFILGAVAVVVGGLYLFYRVTGSLAPVGLVAALGPPAIVIWFMLTACRDPVEGGLSISSSIGNESSPFRFGLGQGPGGGAGGGVPVTSALLLGVLGLVLIGAAVLLVRATGDEIPDEGGEAAPEASPEMAAIGRAAGRAADRIEGDADLDNAVYRAWREMTTYLDVPNPEASTPAEFAAAAVEVGMDAGDVSELTALFEEVRYGEAEATPEREGRALAALRRIESEYADEEVA